MIGRETLGMARILLVCTGNTCRSPLAQVMLAERAPEHSVASAGLSAVPGQTASQGSLGAARRRGLDLSEHRSQSLTAELVEWADQILTMTEAHRERLLQRFPQAQERVATLLSAAGLTGEVEDPFGGDEAAYEACARQLEAALDRLVARV